MSASGVLLVLSQDAPTEPTPFPTGTIAFDAPDGEKSVSEATPLPPEVPLAPGIPTLIPTATITLNETRTISENESPVFSTLQPYFDEPENAPFIPQPQENLPRISNLLFTAQISLVSSLTTLDYAANPIGQADQAFPSSSFPLWRYDAPEFDVLEGTQICRYSTQNIPATQLNCAGAPFIVPSVPNSQWDPVWSPGGEYVAYLQINSTGNRVDIIVVKATGELSPVNLTAGLSTDLHFQPAWSFNGNTIAFVAAISNDPINSASIYRTPYAAANPTAIPYTTGHYAPFWSDNNRLAFTHISTNAIYTVDPFPGFPPPTPFPTPTPSITPTTITPFNYSSANVWGRANSPNFNEPYAYMDPNPNGSFEVRLSNGNMPSTGPSIGVLPKWQPRTSQSCYVGHTGGTATLYRAPIIGANPVPLPRVVSGPNVRLRIEGYAADPLRNLLWFYVAAVGTDSSQSGWALVKTNPNVNVTINGRTLQTTVAVGDATLERAIQPLAADVTPCIPRLANRTESPPVIPWGDVRSSSPFIQYPVRAQDTCAPGIRREIHGFGYSILSRPPYAAPGLHSGVDFFIPEGSPVYSIANNGIVVGIGSTTTESAHVSSIWGSTQELRNNIRGNGYNVIVRYGHFYVLYGHIAMVSASLYVGQAVSQETLIGNIGVFNEPHVHIEIRTFGGAPFTGILALEPNAVSSINPFGILRVNVPSSTPNAPSAQQSGNSEYHAVNVYDVAQFFAASGVTTPDDASVSGLGVDLDNNEVVNVTACSLTYKALTPGGTPAIPVADGIRGFQLFRAEPVAPVSPVVSPMGS